MSQLERARFAAAIKGLQESIAARRRLTIGSREHASMLEDQVKLSVEIRRLAELIRRDTTDG
jgi:hypothetical protein